MLYSKTASSNASGRIFSCHEQHINIYSVGLGTVTESTGKNHIPVGTVIGFTGKNHVSVEAKIGFGLNSQNFKFDVDAVLTDRNIKSQVD